MIITASVAIVLLAATPVQAVEQVDVAYEKLAAGENQAAIREITANEGLDRDDPARLLNLGVAYAREGDFDRARAHFRAAIVSDDRQMLETGSGEWVDSRILARHALAELNEGRFGDQSRMAAR